MPVCCSVESKGRKPGIKIYRSGNGDRTWYAIVGSDMLSRYADRELLLRDARLAQSKQRVMPCGHVLHEGPQKRVVAKDNFGRDNVSEFFVGEPMSEDAATKLCKSLNAQGGDYSPHFYKVVPADYKLYIWEP